MVDGLPVATVDAPGVVVNLFVGAGVASRVVENSVGEAVEV